MPGLSPECVRNQGDLVNYLTLPVKTGKEFPFSLIAAGTDITCRTTTPDLLRQSINAIKAFHELHPGLRSFIVLMADGNGYGFLNRFEGQFSGILSKGLLRLARFEA